MSNTQDLFTHEASAPTARFIVLPQSSGGRPIRIDTRQDRGALILVVAGQLDLDNVAPLDETLQQAARGGDGPVVVDLSAVAFADSATVNVLLQAHDALGAALRLAAPSAVLERLFALTGLDTVLPLYETVGKAVEA
ncbi:STAS domain-containing protein [Streptomyces decoyicus]|uniref:STAS domain-containing protein n=1 Tax=Streptomyces decoyicus TaxID=249567 RepID=UPI000AD04818